MKPGKWMQWVSALLALAALGTFLGGCGGGGGTSGIPGDSQGVGRISGRVTIPGGQDLSGVAIIAERVDKGITATVSRMAEAPGKVDAYATRAATYTAVTGADGSYQIPNVPAGVYTVTAQKTGIGAAFKSEVQVTSRQATIVNLELTPTGAIHGKATVAGQSEHSLIVVAALGTSFAGYTDKDGSYTITGIPAGTYTLGALYNGKMAQVNNVVVNAGETAEAPDISLPGKLSHIEVTPNPATVAVGEALKFTAIGVDFAGNTVSIVPTWSVTGDIGNVDSTGMFYAAHVGAGKTGQVIATADRETGSADVSVEGSTRARYIGADNCKVCHPGLHTDWAATSHNQALKVIKDIGYGTNPRCLACHSVGYTDGGYVSETATPNLANVQCESCHGPGSEHAANNGDKTKILTYPDILRPELTCGKCHNGHLSSGRHPGLEEWENSPHAGGAATEELLGRVSAGNPGTCAECHSGDWRVLVTIKGKDPATVTQELKGRPVEELNPIVCAVCHDPHKRTGNARGETLYPELGWDYQLRAPEANMEGTGLCSGCHRHRPADPQTAEEFWRTRTSRPPHYSLQTNMLLGNMGVEDGGPPAQSAHRDIEKQCAQCHMPPNRSELPYSIGHNFRVNLKGCEPCHTAADASARKAGTQADLESRLARLKSRLENWGKNMSPDEIRSFGAKAWEYSATGYDGPPSAGQNLIPDEIRMARYNYYFIEHDLSFGVHNAKYARYLIDVANRKLDALGVPK